jgi:uncharacterized membrane-anchored protein
MSAILEFRGTARLDRRTKRLVKRLGPDDIAIIDHPELDRVSVEELIESGVRVVVNVSPSVSGRYPNPGPYELVKAGVTLIDAPGAPLFEQIREGDDISVRGAMVFRNATRLAVGRRLTEEELEGELQEQQGRVTEALGAFVDNTMRYLREEGRLLTEGIALPQLQTRFRDRHALVVARGPGYKRDLQIVRHYIREYKPVLVAVDGGADALLDAGYKPHVIVGDMDSVSDRALQSGAELIVHAYEGGQAPGRDRLDRLGLAHVAVPMSGISEDLAMLLAYEKGADLIVAVGTHFNLVEFLERNRAGMSSTFLTRLKVGEILIDARGVSRLFRHRAGLWPLVAFGLAACAAVGAAVAGSPELRDFVAALVDRVRSLLGLG